MRMCFRLRRLRSWTRFASNWTTRQANSQIAIVTVQTMNGDDAADYANQLEDKWKMGKKGRTRACWCCWPWATTSTASMWATALKEF